MKNNLLKGSVLVALGASSYGMLATFVKIAYHEGFSIAEVTFSQYLFGFAGLLILTLCAKKKPVGIVKQTGLRSIFKLIFAGTSMGLTSIFYYLAVQYIPVSVAIVLLMQTVWMGVVLEMILYKKAPETRKLFSVVVILIGTVLATDLIKEPHGVNWTGFAWGILAAVCYTATMYSSNHLEIYSPPLKRSLYMILGGLIVIAVIFYPAFDRHFSYQIFLRWGPVLSLFGTIIPPLLFTRGMPLTGVGLGAIIAALEIPITILMAYIILKEPVNLSQWLGVLLILSAVIVMNIKKKVSLNHS
jgi:drug/metabolite transporter (DMT)-like permease